MRARAGGVFIVVFIAAFVSLVLSACGAGRPSDGRIRDLIAEEVHATGDDPLFELRDFERIDGREAGEGRYVADVRYTLVYLKSSEEMKQAAQDDLDGTPDGPDDVGEAIGKVLEVIGLALQDFEKGDTRDVRATVTLERWDSGWRLVRDD